MPVIFAPVVLRTFPDRCTSTMPNWAQQARRDATAPPILKAYGNALTRYRDGTLCPTSSFSTEALSTIMGSPASRLPDSASTPYAPLTAREAANVRRLLFLVIDGGKGPTGDWANTAEGPTAPEIIWAAANMAIDLSVRSSYTAFDRTMSEWRDGLIVGDALFRWRTSVNMA